MSAIYLRRSLIETAKSYGLSALLAFVILFNLSWFVNCHLLYFVGGTLFLTSVFANFVVKWMPKARISPEGKAVFISGCDSGFGHMLAQRLNDIGFHVFAGCLFPDGDGATNLRRDGSSRLHVFGLDVTNEVSVQEAAAYVKENLKQNVLWAVVNNAGIGTGGELDWTSVETIQKIIEVNTLGVVRVTKAFLSELKESKGRILTVTSIVGRSSCPAMVPYCMSKAAAISFCDGFRLEMYKWGIQVIIIEPANYRTPILDPEVIAKTMRQEWEKAPQDVKDTYTSNYIKKFTKMAVALPHYFSRHPSELVSVIEEAVTTLFPEYCYTSGNLIFRLMVWLSQNLPRPISDTFSFFIFGMYLE